MPAPLFVDTSVWSLAFRRDRLGGEAEVVALHDALYAGATVVSTGLVLQELLQGLRGSRQRDVLIDRFRSLPMLVPDRHDHVEAADIRNRCRQRGVHLGTADALLASLCMRRGLELLTTDQDFVHATTVVGSLRLWGPCAP